MTIITGTINFQLRKDTVTGFGFSISDKELCTALSCPVVENLNDDAGKESIGSFLKGLVDTDFEKEGFEGIFLILDRLKICV